MKRTFLAIAVLALSSPAWATIAQVGTGGSRACGNVTNCGAASLALTAGDQIYVWVAIMDSGTSGDCNTQTPTNCRHVSTVVDSQSSTYDTAPIAWTSTPAQRSIGTCATVGVCRLRMELWHTANVASTNASGTVTVTVSAANVLGAAIAVQQFSGIQAIAQTSCSSTNCQNDYNSSNCNGNTNTGCSSSATVSVTTDDANDALAGCVADYPQSTFTSTAGTKFPTGTVGDANGNYNLLCGDNITVTGAGSTATFSASIAAASLWESMGIELRTSSSPLGGGVARHKPHWM